MTSAHEIPELEAALADDTAYEDEHGHHHGPLEELITIRDLIRYATSQLTKHKVFFGHGLQNAYDEAVYLVFTKLHLPHEQLEVFLDASVTLDERVEVLETLRRRVEDRVPAAYLTNEAWLGEYSFYVDERVIIPRSYFAELLENGFEPWVEDADALGSALDLCTGSGCLAILMADVFPNARIVAVDLSDDALEVAKINLSDYDLEDRIELVKSDVFSGLQGQTFDLIISNPPYVTQESMDNIPDEYRHEPEMALVAGDDGLDVVRTILREAADHLNPGGHLAVEVGHNQHIVDAAYPDLPFMWLDSPSGNGKVFLLRREDLI